MLHVPSHSSFKSCIFPVSAKSKPLDYNLANLVEKVIRGVVNVACKGIQNQQQQFRSGSGWLYKPQTRRNKNNIYVITAAHVVLISDIQHPFPIITVEITGINEDPLQISNFDAQIEAVDATSDIALLKVLGLTKNTLRGLVTLKFANSALEKQGNPCFIIGNPLGIDVQSCSSGIIKDPQFAGVLGLYIQEQLLTDIVLLPGNSGGPCFNKEGKVISMIAFQYTVNMNINLNNTNNNNNSQRATPGPGLGGGVSSRAMVPILQNMLHKKRITPVQIIKQPLYPICPRTERCGEGGNDSFYPKKIKKKPNQVNQNFIFTYRKASLGDISWLLLTNQIALIQYPQTYKKLNMQGLIIRQIFSSNNVFYDSTKKKQILKSGDIVTAIQDPCENWIPIGTFNGQYAMGLVLWCYDPNRKPLVKVKAIQNPKQNTKERIFQFVLDINYPKTESPPNANGELSEF